MAAVTVRFAGYSVKMAFFLGVPRFRVRALLLRLEFERGGSIISIICFRSSTTYIA